MRIGLLTRGDKGGLGYQTRYLAQLLDVYGMLAGQIVVDVEPRRGSWVAPLDVPTVPEGKIVEELDAQGWKDKIDVLLSVETFYDSDVLIWCSAHSVRPILIGNPELTLETACPTIVWPTPWLKEENVAVWPIRSVAVSKRSANDRAFRVMHVNAPAMLDREGTAIIAEGLTGMAEPHFEFTVVCDDPAAWRSRFPDWVQIMPRRGELWSSEVDAIVQCRRYGGLSLIAWEAMTHKVAYYGASRSPENLLGLDYFDTTSTGTCVPMKGGMIELDDMYPSAVRNLFDLWATQDNAVNNDLATRRVNRQRATLRVRGGDESTFVSRLEALCK